MECKHPPPNLISLVVPIVALADELCLVILLEDVNSERVLVQLVTLTNELGLVIQLENVNDKLGLGMQLMALAVSIATSGLT